MLIVISSLAAQLNADFNAPWYGTWKLSPDEPNPTPDGPLYPPTIYGSYDPNWREFVGTTLIQVVEEFEHLLPASLVSRIVTALESAAVGGMRRNGTFPEDDNLTLGYSNIGLMRVLTTGWVGKRKNDAKLIKFAQQQGQDLLKLFKRDDNGLGEYNAPNYYGIDIWALAANIKYGPTDLPMTKNSEYILKELFKDIAAHYNPYLGNMVGPNDRAYSRDATAHSQIVSMVMWGVFGRGQFGEPPLGEADLLYDTAQGAAFALVMDAIAQTIDKKTAAALTAKGSWKGERYINKTIYDNLETKKGRVICSWVSQNVMIGGQTVQNYQNHGDQYVPAVVQWAADPSRKPYAYMGWFSLYPDSLTITSKVSANRLVLSYPNATQPGSERFTFALSGIPPSWTLGQKHVVTGLESLPCLSVNVNAPGLKKLPVTYGTTLRDHWIYNVTYAVPQGFKGTPSVTLDMNYTC